MATAIKLKSAIKQLEAAMKSNAVSKENKAKFKTQLDKAKSDLASLSSPTPKKAVTKTKVLTALQKLKGIIKSNKALSGYKNSGIDIEKDANEPAMKRGRRVSKGLKANKYGTAAENKGRVYYEYRLNRADVKQPPKKYPKLEDGGMMEDEGLFAKGGSVNKSWVVNLSNQEGGDYKTYNVKAKSEDEAINKAFIEISNDGEESDEYQLDSVYISKMSDGGYMAKGGGLWIKSYADDKRLKALHQGKRIAAESGKVYYENRLDHADVDRRIRLEDGGYMAKGGITEHGLRMYDTIISGGGIGKTTVRVRNEQHNEDARVDLNTGKRTLLEYNRSTKKWEEKKEEGDEYAQGGGLWIKSYADDKRLKALHQGKRIAAESGKVYYENRLDHADVDRRRRLEHGGEMHRLEDSI